MRLRSCGMVNRIDKATGCHGKQSRFKLKTAGRRIKGALRTNIRKDARTHKTNKGPGLYSSLLKNDR